MTKVKYLRKREAEHLLWTQRHDYNFTVEIHKRMDRLKKELVKETQNVILNHSKELNISPEEFSRLVATTDIAELQSKVSQYVSMPELSERAKKELAWYNKVTRLSRAELLTRSMDVHLTGTMGEIEYLFANYLHEMTLEELRRQAGILGLSVAEQRDLFLRAKSIAEAPFHGATYSENLWLWKEKAEDALIQGVHRSLILGQNPVKWMKSLEKFYIGEIDNLTYGTKRLAVTESARAQIYAQKVSYEVSEYDEFMVICEPTACPECTPFDGKTEKVKEMSVGDNAPPFHPNCKCSTAANLSDEAVEKAIQDWLK